MAWFVKFKGTEDPDLDRLSVGFIGAGNHASKVHYPSLSKMEDVDLVSVCSRTREKAEKAARTYGVPRTYTDFKQMVDKERLDAVYVITQPEDLTKIALHCLSKRKNVFMEKPPGVSLEETKKMALVAEKNDCKTMVGFNRRFMPVMTEARRILASEGTPVNLCVAQFYRGLRGEPKDVVLIKNTIHAVDTLRSIEGEVRKVVSCLETVEGNYGHIFRILLEFENKARGVLIASYVSASKVERYEMGSRDAYAVVDAPGKAVVHLKGRTEPLVFSGEELAGTHERHRLEGFYQESRHFIECVKRDEMPETSLQDSVKTMELVETIVRSSQPLL